MKVSRNPPIEIILSEEEEIFEGNSRSTSIVPENLNLKLSKVSIHRKKEKKVKLLTANREVHRIAVSDCDEVLKYDVMNPLAVQTDDCDEVYKHDVMDPLAVLNDTTVTMSVNTMSRTSRSYKTLTQSQNKSQATVTMSVNTMSRILASYQRGKLASLERRRKIASFER